MLNIIKAIFLVVKIIVSNILIYWKLKSDKPVKLSTQSKQNL